jgi:hypothetical protein
MDGMFEHEGNNESFEETVRSIARELGRSVERAMERVDLDEVADSIGVDPMSAREWADSIGGWIRSQAENLGDGIANRGFGAPGPAPAPKPRPEPAADAPARSAAADPLSSAQPHPLDLPSTEQGVALAALDSGRWSVEAGTNRLTAHGDGPGPEDALGLVRELRVRDWVAADGTLTAAGRHALERWLDVAA